MSTIRALVIASVVDSLIGRFRSHMLSQFLPAPAYVELDVHMGRVTVQIDFDRRPDVELAHLLLWAHSLHEVTAEWWRTSADRLLIFVHGRTGGGLPIRLYIGPAFPDLAALVRLEPDERDIVTLDELCDLARLLREAPSDKGAA